MYLRLSCNTADRKITYRSISSHKIRNYTRNITAPKNINEHSIFHMSHSVGIFYLVDLKLRVSNIAERH